MSFIILVSPTLAYLLPETYGTHAHTRFQIHHITSMTWGREPSSRFWVRRVEKAFEEALGFGGVGSPKGRPTRIFPHKPSRF